MLELAAKQYHLPADTVTKIIQGQPGSANSTHIFEETALEPRLQAGQLDAASAYLSQAMQLHLHYITLPADHQPGRPVDEGAVRERVLSNSPAATWPRASRSPLAQHHYHRGAKDKAAANAFVAYVLSPAGSRPAQAGRLTSCCRSS